MCFANEKMKAEKHRMISLRCGKTRLVPEYLRNFGVYNEKYLKSAPATEGGGCAIQFSAELMGNRATCQIVACICFLVWKKTEFVPHRAHLLDAYMRIHEIRHICGLGAMHLWQGPPGVCPRMQHIQFA